MSSCEVIWKPPLMFYAYAFPVFVFMAAPCNSGLFFNTIIKNRAKIQSLKIGLNAKPELFVLFGQFEKIIKAFFEFPRPYVGSVNIGDADALIGG